MKQYKIDVIPPDDEVGWLSINSEDGDEFTADFGSSKVVAARLRSLGYKQPAAFVAKRRSAWSYLDVVSVRKKGSGHGTAIMMIGLSKLYEFGARNIIAAPSPSAGKMSDLIRFYERFGIHAQSIGGQLWLVGKLTPDNTR